MDAVTGSLPPELDVRAVRVLCEIDAIRAEAEAALFPSLGLEPRPASATPELFGYGEEVPPT
jgi:hypothetical protein